MGSSTPLLKYPYPVSTDKIAEGADNMEDITEAVENSRKIANNKFTADEPGSSYPLGHSHMYITGSGVSLGWPANYGNVITIQGTPSNAGWQWFYRYSGGALSQVYLREYTTGAGGWQAWQQIAGQGKPTAEASGTFYGQMPNETDRDPVVYTVSFPSNRFTSSPKVWFQPVTSTPAQAYATVGSAPSTTSMTVYYWRATAAGTGTPNTNRTAVWWYAREGDG